MKKKKKEKEEDKGEDKEEKCSPYNCIFSPSKKKKNRVFLRFRRSYLSYKIFLPNVASKIHACKSNTYIKLKHLRRCVQKAYYLGPALYTLIHFYDNSKAQVSLTGQTCILTNDMTSKDGSVSQQMYLFTYVPKLTFGHHNK